MTTNHPVQMLVVCKLSKLEKLLVSMTNISSEHRVSREYEFGKFDNLFIQVPPFSNACGHWFVKPQSWRNLWSRGYSEKFGGDNIVFKD